MNLNIREATCIRARADLIVESLLRSRARATAAEFREDKLASERNSPHSGRSVTVPAASASPPR
jgi:hypothetical protein